jgi:thiol-disulfide isomerase/thioredoxin
VPAGPSAAWSEGTPAQRAGLADIEGKGAAPLKVVESSWVNSDPTDLAALRGKVVLLDFWGTWCGPCLQTVPKINALHEKYGKDGLVVIGVCHSRNSATMPEVAQKHGIAYPIVADTAGATFKAYRVNGTPDYFLIDRAGTIRFADIANAHIEDAIRFLLAEPAPAAAPN